MGGAGAPVGIDVTWGSQMPVAMAQKGRRFPGMCFLKLVLSCLDILWREGVRVRLVCLVGWRFSDGFPVAGRVCWAA